MTSWSEVPEALRVEAERFLALHVHKTMATLRADGSPRISGTELSVRDGELWFGSMPGALKARDLLRDPRVALHSGSEDPPAWAGDAKVAGLAVPSTEWARGVGEGEQGEADLFRLDVQEVSVVVLAGDHLEVSWWRPGQPVQTVQRG
ncbi:MAG: Pyridoxamine 5-phosphate oxidase-related FMN-binding protein [Frankiales bacterium]|nr:Pyridoxamine 5-phosphate oxidase-related FMN-binding protein [Frankiales bacterium]